MPRLDWGCHMSSTNAACTACRRPTTVHRSASPQRNASHSATYFCLAFFFNFLGNYCYLEAAAMSSGRPKRTVVALIFSYRPRSRVVLGSRY
jgi:hypothetical protein